MAGPLRNFARVADHFSESFANLGFGTEKEKATFNG
jgi:hypothetical protein